MASSTIGDPLSMRVLRLVSMELTDTLTILRMLKYKVFEGMYYGNKGGLRCADYTLVMYFLGIPIKTTFFECIDDWKKDGLFYKYQITKIKL
ncbi:MAG: hypothetical protein RL621_1768 [Bacteroidota bacterium]|jgi:hypothetical protein